MKRKILPYDPHLKDIAKRLRRNMTLSEVLLWNELKQQKMLGADFDRQRPILNYVVGFYCKDLMLAIEIDGNSHEEKFEDDMKRQQELETAGVRFLRFGDLQVKRDMANVIYAIEGWIENALKEEGLMGREE